MKASSIPIETESPFLKMRNGVKDYLLDIFTYSTVRSASIQSFKVGVVYRFAQILLLLYIVGWELIHNKGYQKFDSVSSVVTTKVKGQGFVPVNKMLDRKANRSDPNYYKQLFTIKPDVEYKILDTADYVIPPNEYNSIFVMTNFIRTDQVQGLCDEVDFLRFIF